MNVTEKTKRRTKTKRIKVKNCLWLIRCISIFFSFFFLNILKSLTVEINNLSFFDFQVNLTQCKRIFVTVKELYFYLSREITKIFCMCADFADDVRQTKILTAAHLFVRSKWVWISCERARAVYEKYLPVNHSLTKMPRTFLSVSVPYWF